MSKVSVAEAAELVGRSRKTLYRHIDSGTLSVSRNNDNVIQVDIAELIRVYGELQKPEANVSIPDTNDETINETTLKLFEAEKKIAVLEERIRGLNNLIDAKDDNIETLEKTVYLIEDRSTKDQDEPQMGFLQRIFYKQKP